MLKTILVVIALLALLAGGAWVWVNYGAQLAQLPGRLEGLVVEALKSFAAGLGGLGAAVADSFRSVIP